MPAAALGFRAHSGWAALVAVMEAETGLVVVDRRRVELADPGVPGFPQPYHAAEPLSFAKAGALIEACTAASRRLAIAAVQTAIEDLRTCGLRVGACGFVTSSAKPLPALDSILTSHALIHTAEGEMFRQALAWAAGECGLAVRPLRERDAYEIAGGVLGLDADTLRSKVAGLGASLGPPWREDQKLSSLAGWLALRAAASS